MEKFVWETTEEINENLAKRIRNIRRRRRISQERLSEISGVSLGSVKRFEATGNISLLSLTRISISHLFFNGKENRLTENPSTSQRSLYSKAALLSDVSANVPTSLS